MIALAASPLKADRVYAATKSGLFASDDAGRTWTPSGLEGDRRRDKGLDTAE